MKLYEITSARKAWSDPDWESHYKARHIRGDISRSLPSFQKLPKEERDKDWPTDIWDQLSDEEKGHLTGLGFDTWKGKDVERTLEKVIALSEPTDRDIVSYRGIGLNEQKVHAMIKKLEARKTVRLKNTRPSSFTNKSNKAWNFSDRHGGSNTRVLLEVLIPAGTKIGRIATHHGIGSEHVVSKNHAVVIDKYKRYRKGYKMTGKLT